MPTNTPAQAPAVTSAQEHRLLLLATIADTDKSDHIRLEAIRDLQESLPTTNPLRYKKPEVLLDCILPGWAHRLYLQKGRAVMRQVSRPPVSLADLWG